ncbi:MAG: hypothetical protein F4034_06240 [Chloroflexi bacterium]|nr:hypothetical protein [Chloroflexota bacterium]
MPRQLRKGDAFPLDYNALLRAPRIEHAVYLFWSKSKACFVYIGKTDRTLPKRLRDHWLDCHNPTLRAWILYEPDDLIVCYIACPASVLPKLERRSIRRLDPIANKDYKV